MAVKQRLVIIGTGVSVLACACSGGRLYEPLSSMAWRFQGSTGIRGYWSRFVIQVTEVFDRGHCRRAWTRTIRGNNDEDGDRHG